MDIELAASAVDDPEGRWLHGLFWFRAVDAIDELALESLSAGRPAQALRLWDQRIARGGRDVMSCLLNRAVLNLALASVSPESDPERLAAGLDGLGRALSDYPLAVRGDLPASRWAEMLRRLPDLLLSFVRQVRPRAFGPEDLGLIGAVGAFPQEVRDDIRARLVNPVFARIDAAIVDSNGLEEALDVYARLRQAVGSADIRLQVLGNRLSSAYFEWSVLHGPSVESVSGGDRQIFDIVETLPVTTGVLDQARVVQALNDAASEPAARVEVPPLVVQGLDDLATNVPATDLDIVEVVPEIVEIDSEIAQADATQADSAIAPVVVDIVGLVPDLTPAMVASQPSASPIVAERVTASEPEPEPEPQSEPEGTTVLEPIVEPLVASEDTVEAFQWPEPARPASAASSDPGIPAFLRPVPPAHETVAESTATFAAEQGLAVEPPASLVPGLASVTANGSGFSGAEMPPLPDRAGQVAAAKRSLADRMQRGLVSIEDAAAMIDGARPDLTKLKAMLGRDNPQYLFACEALATVALDHLVPIVDLERERSELANDPAAARAVLERAEIAARKLAMLDLGAEARERVARFLGALRDLIDQDEETVLASTGRMGRLPQLAVGAGLAAASVAAVLAWLMGG